MNFRNEIEIERKKRLGLDEVNTKMIYDKLISYYKQRLIEAPREVVGYTISIVLCNMNYYNKLGKLEELNSNWGDNNFYVDPNYSGLIELETDETGNVEGSNDVLFKDVEELNSINNVSFSLKEMIELCEKDDFEASIFAGGDEISLDINPYKKFTMNSELETYLNSLKK
ncbi:MAG: hypothetical protein IJ572_02985 [Bacilli bacterium]|nr:hypothetical protein [Bacilli bacterium]